MGKLSRDKGARTERELVALLTKLGIRAERVPLSGAARYQGNGHDIDIYYDRDEPPLITQVKRLHDTKGVKTVISYLSDADMLLLRCDAEPGQPVSPPLVVATWDALEKLLTR